MIHLVTALPCEAKPLISRYRLNGRQAQHGFRIYENEHLRLIVSGLGKLNCAAACAYLQALDVDRQAAWLNLGIAGHAEFEIGTPLLAAKISEPGSDLRYYPPALPDSPCPRVALVSRDTPSPDYPANAACDMEASAFYATALRFSNSEVIQVFKLVSDNQEHGIDQITAEKTEAMIAERMEQIDTVIHQLQARLQQLQQINATPIGFATFIERWHFSVSQQHQLQRLLQQWQARSGETVAIDTFQGLKNSKQVIQQLQQRLAELPYRFDT